MFAQYLSWAWFGCKVYRGYKDEYIRASDRGSQRRWVKYCLTCRFTRAGRVLGHLHLEKVVGGFTDGLFAKIFRVCKGDVFQVLKCFSGYNRAFLLRQCRTMDGFPRCHCCLGRMNNRSVVGAESGQATGLEETSSCPALG